MSLMTDNIGQFVKSTYSSGDGNCVEAARTPGQVLVRDSKDRGGPLLAFTDAEWSAFLAGAAAGEFNLD